MASKPLLKVEQIRIRVTSRQKNDFAKEARRQGLSLSSWIVSIASRASNIEAPRRRAAG